MQKCEEKVETLNEPKGNERMRNKGYEDRNFQK